MAITVSHAADYDSLAAYRALVRAETNYKAGHFTDNDLDYLINLAAGFVQADLKSRCLPDTIIMSGQTLRYALNSDAMSNTVKVIIWKDKYKNERALAPLPPEMIGKPLTNPGPYYYTIAERTLIIHNQVVHGDTLFVFYPPMATRMTSTSDAAGIDETDAVAVAYMAAAFVNVNRGRYQNTAFWYSVYQAYKRAKLGIVNAPQD